MSDASSIPLAAQSAEAAAPRLRGKPLPPGHFERECPRFAVELPVQLQVRIPEMRPEPFALEGTTGDVSLRGLRVVIEDMNGRFYARLLAGARSVDLQFVNPARSEDVRITGKIVWIDYRKSQARTDSGPCQLGIRLEEIARPDFAAYERFVNCIEPA